MLRRFLIAGLLLAGPAVLLGAGPALAQLPRRMSGVIEAVVGDQMAVRLHDGTIAAIVVTPNTRIGALVNRALADIRPGDFVGTASVRGTDGKRHALEVHIFPEAMRGTGVGSRPMEEPGQTMTNATVAEVAVAPSGHELTLKYPGGRQVIEVAPTTRIVELIQGDRGLLKPGAAVMVFATPGPAGHFSATFIQAEKDGVKPLL
jgi:hypothetical protein